MKIKNGLASLLLLFAAGSAALLEARVPDEAPPLFERMPDAHVPPHAPDSSITREEVVLVNIPLVSNEKTKRLRLPLFGGPELLLIRDSRRLSHGEAVVWSGHVDRQLASVVTLVAGKGVLIGNVATQGTRENGANSYEIRYRGNGIHVLRQINPSALPPESDPLIFKNDHAEGGRSRSAAPFFSAALNADHSRFPQGGDGDGGNPRFEVASRGAYGRSSNTAEPTLTCTSDRSGTIDALVVYTPKARDAAGGAVAIEWLIVGAIEETNKSFGDSGIVLEGGITPQIRLVRTQVVAYDEKDGPTDDLQVLIHGLDNVPGIRNDVGADIVGLIVEYTEQETSDCGQSTVMEELSTTFEKFAYSAVPGRCAFAPQRWSLAHEFGHLMGARHGWSSDRKDKPFLFSHAYVHPDSPGNPGFRTLMAKCVTGQPCDRVLFWSNPSIHYPDPVTGSPGPLMGETKNLKKPTNNAETLKHTIPIVANFRCGKN